MLWNTLRLCQSALTRHHLKSNVVWLAVMSTGSGRRTHEARALSWTDFWWRVTSEEVGAFWYAYASAWLSVSLLRPENQARLVDAWLAASRQWPVSSHFNKGLAGAPPAVISAAQNTATNPDVLDVLAFSQTADLLGQATATPLACGWPCRGSLCSK
jgi:hypothetical protein